MARGKTRHIAKKSYRNPNKRAHTDRSLGYKVEILSQLEKGATQRSIHEKTGIPLSTLSGWLVEKEKLRKQLYRGVDEERKRDTPSFLPDINDALVGWLREVRRDDRQLPVSEATLIQKAN